MSDDTWHITRIKSTFSHRLGPPQPPPNHIVVVFHRGMCLGLIGPHIQLKLTDCLQGLYEFWMIPTGGRKLRPITEQLASNVPGVYFEVVVEIQFRITSPETVARLHAESLPQDLERELRWMIQQHTNQFGPLEWQRVNQAIEDDLLRRRQLDVGVEILNFLVKVSMDSQIEQRFRQAFELRDLAMVDDATLEREIQQVRRDMLLDQAQNERALADEENKDLLFQRRMNRYSKVLRQGRIELFAALLAEPDNEQLRLIIEYFESQGNRVISKRWGLFLEMLKSDDMGVFLLRIKQAIKALGIDEHLQLDDSAGGDGKSQPLLDDDDDSWMQDDDKDDNRKEDSTSWPNLLCARFDNVPPGKPLSVGSLTPFVVWISSKPDVRLDLFRSVSVPFKYEVTRELEPIEFSTSVRSGSPLILIRQVEPILLVTPKGATAQEAVFLICALRPVKDTLYVTITRKRDNVTIQHLWVEVDAVELLPLDIDKRVKVEPTDMSSSTAQDGKPLTASAQASSTVKTDDVLVRSLLGDFAVSADADNTTRTNYTSKSVSGRYQLLGLPINDAFITHRPVRIAVHKAREDDGYQFFVDADLPDRRLGDMKYPVPIGRAYVQTATQRVRTALAKILNYVDRSALGAPTPFRDPATFSIDPIIARRQTVALAEAGQRLWRTLFAADQSDGDLLDLAEQLRKLPQGTRLLVALQSPDFIIPWPLMYDGPNPVTEENLTSEGFWGYRFVLDVLLPGDYPSTRINGSSVPLQMLLNDQELRQLGEAQWNMLNAELRHILPSSAYGAAAMAALSDSIQSPLVYAFCHGEDPIAAGMANALPADARLIFGVDAKICLADMPLRTEQTRPVIFLNACHSAAVQPLFADGFAGFFINKRGARAFIGTETEIPQALAHDAALRFWRAFDQGESIAKILYDLRRYYLDQHNNILAFAYSLYGPGDVHLAQE